MVLGAISPERPEDVVEPKPPNCKAEFVPVVAVVGCPNCMPTVDAVVVPPNGFIAENPVIPSVPVPETLAPRFGAPKDFVGVPLPNEKPVEPPPRKPPVVAAAILLSPHLKRANENVP